MHHRITNTGFYLKETYSFFFFYLRSNHSDTERIEIEMKNDVVDVY